jgi:hypothetical protein
MVTTEQEIRIKPRVGEKTMKWELINRGMITGQLWAFEHP